MPPADSSLSAPAPSGASRPLRVALADDHLILQSGIISLLGKMPDMVCVGLASNGDEAMQLVIRERPHVLVVDLSMPGLPVLRLIRLLREIMPRLRIVVLTMHATPFAMAEVFKAGAHAFVVKDDPFSVLVSFIRRVCRGESRLHSTVVDKTAFFLTERERDVLRGLSRGMSGKELSTQMGVNPRTIEMYRCRLLKKFNVEKSTELVRLALESGVLRMTPAQPSAPPFVVSADQAENADEQDPPSFSDPHGVQDE